MYIIMPHQVNDNNSPDLSVSGSAAKYLLYNPVDHYIEDFEYVPENA